MSYYEIVNKLNLKEILFSEFIRRGHNEIQKQSSVTISVNKKY